jgi:hypothetical protein
MPKLSQAANQTLPIPAARVPTKIANKVIQFPSEAQTSLRTKLKTDYACATEDDSNLD